MCRELLCELEAGLCQGERQWAGLEPCSPLTGRTCTSAPTVNSYQVLPLPSCTHVFTSPQLLGRRFFDLHILHLYAPYHAEEALSQCLNNADACCQAMFGEESSLLEESSQIWFLRHAVDTLLTLILVVWGRKSWLEYRKSLNKIMR